VDTKEDLAVVTKIIDTLYPINKCFTLADMLHLLDQHPEWAKINAHIEQKKI
jgi:spore coat polysaccharide biosynthesis protein SpsF